MQFYNMQYVFQNVAIYQDPSRGSALIVSQTGDGGYQAVSRTSGDNSPTMTAVLIS